MVERGSVSPHPSRPPIDRGPWAGVKCIGRVVAAEFRRPQAALLLTPGPWPLTTGKYSLFRYGHGAAANYVANKKACRQNAPGPSRHTGGTICGK